MENDSTKFVSRIAIFIVVLIFSQSLSVLSYGLDSVESKKIELLSQILYARDSGDLTTAREKAEKLIEIEPNDENIQKLLLSINAKIVQEGLLDEVLLLESNKGVTKEKNNSEDQVSEELYSHVVGREFSSEFIEQSHIINELLIIGFSQKNIGDYDSATKTFNEVLSRDPNNIRAKDGLIEIAQELDNINERNLIKTREEMLGSINDSWDRPRNFEFKSSIKNIDQKESELKQRLERIILPKINFTGIELTEVIDTLSELSLEHDPDEEGVNIVVLFNPSVSNPKVNMTLRNLSLDRVLEFITQQVNFTYDIGDDAITIQPSDSLGGASSTVTEFFPVPISTVIRLTGIVDSPTSLVANSLDSIEDGEFNSIQDQKTQALKNFFQNAGVNFNLEGTSLAYTGDRLIVTQTPRNIKRLGAILRQYDEVKQVEIETKFLEVNQSDLDELGFSWKYGDRLNSESSGINVDLSNRGVNDLIGGQTSSSQLIVTSPAGDLTEQLSAPTITQTLDSGPAGNTLSMLKESTQSSWLGQADIGQIDLDVRALARKSGTDLMSAPKVTVLSGKRASIKVAQELVYPNVYGEIRSSVSSASSVTGNAGGGGVTITAGTPQDFKTRNVGVEMDVTPTVQTDDTITLNLNPRVTEFEGFVEYGGPSIAIQDNTSAVVPAGFYQPIFSTREISTEVTILDGATVVMGGLTRDEVKTLNDKVPVLGDLPGIGRLFRSEGETRQKRNLLIFVTANLVNPGGALSKQEYNYSDPKTIYQSPKIVTPAANVSRNIQSDN